MHLFKVGTFIEIIPVLLTLRHKTNDMKKYFFLSMIVALTGLTTSAQSSFKTNLENSSQNYTRFALYPNPAQGAATLNIDGFQGPYIVKVFNSAGTPVYQNKETRSAQLPVMKWQTGLYYVFVTNEKNELLYQDKLMVKSQ